MTVVLPPPPPPPSAAPAASFPRVQMAAEPHSEAARLPVGSSLKGQILPGALKGLVHIQTDAGMLAGKSTLPLPEGADVTLLLQARTPRLQFQIITMNGQPAQAPPMPSSRVRAAPNEDVTISPRAPAQSTATRTPPPLARGASTTATLLQPAQWAPAETGPSTALPPGSQLAVRVTAVHSPAAGSSGVVLPPSGSPAGSPALTAGQILSGAVMTATPGAPPLLGTPLGALGLDAISALPRGSIVTLEMIEPLALPPPASGTAGTPALPHPNAAFAEWPALEAALDALQGLNPAAARHVTDTVLPRLDAGLTAQTLFFLRALGRGNVDEWLGGVSARALKIANPALHSQLRDEFRQMGRTSGEAESNDWRTLHLPLALGSQIEPVRLLMRRNGGGRNGGAKADPSTRFVVEVTLSRLGRIQFDGLVREDGKRLDLIVRSDPPLPRTVHGNIRALFSHSNEIAGLKGDVGFQASPPEFVDITAEHSAIPHTGMIV